MRRFLHKHNGLLASVLTLVLIISGSLQLLHDQLLDHQHGPDCVMFAVDGQTPVGQQSGQCHISKQAPDVTPFSPIALVLSQLEKQQARAPPIRL